MNLRIVPLSIKLSSLIFYMKGIKYQKWIIIFISSLFVPCIFVGFIAFQPLFWDEDFKPSHTFTWNAIALNLKQSVKFLSENNRTSKEWQEKIIWYLTGVLETYNITNSPCLTFQNRGCSYYEFQDYYIDERLYRNIVIHFKQLSEWDIALPQYIIWAHYDAFGGLPGADDNASGVAWILEIARILQENSNTMKKKINIDLILYSTEEPPFFATENMGSYVHAESENGNNIKLVIILEMIGYFSDEENSQQYPVWLLSYIYPTKGNYIGIISNFDNSFVTRKLKRVMNTYLSSKQLVPVFSMNAPPFLVGVDFSDHRNYWKFGIPSVMITDTAFYRNANYHTPDDTYEKLDYEKMSEVIDAVLYSVVSI